MANNNSNTVNGSKTLFVENLPFAASNDQLEAVFSEFGPLKNCFVVSDRHRQGQCKGVGYVKFASSDDAFTALKKAVQLGGRRLLLSLADNKVVKSKEKKKKRLDNNAPDESATDSVAAFENDPGLMKENEAENKACQKTSKPAAALRTVIVHAVKTEDEITKLAGNFKRIRNLSFETDASGEKFASILYRGKRDAIVAVKRFLGLKMNANLLSVKNNGKTNLSSEANPKKSRLIVRNLSFKCTVDDLQRVFSEFGEIVEVNIPKRENGKKLGFGIVQFKTIDAADRAVEEMNGKSVLGRPVAVDWTLPKSKYESISQQTELRNSVKRKRKKTPEETEKQRNDSTTDDDEKEVDEDEDGGSSDGEENEVDRNGNHLDLNLDSNDDTDNDINTSCEEEEEDEEEGEEVGEEEYHDITDEDAAASDDEDEHETKEEEEEEEEDKSNAKRRKIESRKQKELNPDVDQGRTVFIRNLAFDSMEEDLEELMNERFGDVRYCRIVMDKSMEHSKGTAFVQFKTKEQAEECIQASASSVDGLILDGRRLTVSLALPKQKANELKMLQSKEVVDKRNLHLIRVGLIRPGTQEAADLTPADLQKRMKVEAITRQKLKNPNIFVSSTRLCVRNIPVSVDDHSLSQTFHKASGNPKAKITECRIMRDLQRVSSNGLGKSRGYGFINFESHEDALNALKNTNNNPEIYGEKRRLIVEFSLENKAALLAKQRRMEKSLKKSDMPQKKKGCKKFQPDIIAPKGGQKSGLPSHWGPKIRHKSRPEIKKKVKNLKTVGSDKQTITLAKKKKKNKKNLTEITDNLDKLIESYKTKFSNV